ncbi:MAG TPA: flagellar export protein FliJ [Bacillales bacterium]|nr:flagellar export protein FliJ [Bacillales bacterium]
MTFHFSFEKVLTVKENEKNVLETEYRDAYNEFEKIANMLYGFMKQKETLETRQRDHMTKGTSAFHIQRLQTDIQRLQEKIDRCEGLYQSARQNIEQKKARLTDKSIDVKRFERLKEVHYDMFRKKEKAEEMSQIDEISTIRRVES